MKRYATIQKINPIVDYLQDCTSKDAFIEFITQYMMSEEERVKAELAKHKEESKEIDLE